MNLKALIVHRLDKQVQQTASVILRDYALSIGPREIELISNVKQVYYKKSNPSYGVFNENILSYPFQVLLKRYIEAPAQFYSFTIDAMNHLLGLINDVSQATGGYVLFAHYGLQEEDFIITVMLNNKRQYNISDNLSIEEIFSLDIDKLDVANFVNVTRWIKGADTYLSFARGHKEISNYFRNFIGCTDQISAKQSSTLLKEAFLDYIQDLTIEKVKKEELRNQIFDYCIHQAKIKEDISLQHISSIVDNENPELFQQFASSEKYQVSAYVKGHHQTLKSLKYYFYRSLELSISFDSALINERIFYNEETNELRIKDVPEDLRRQLKDIEKREVYA